MTHGNFSKRIFWISQITNRFNVNYTMKWNYKIQLNFVVFVFTKFSVALNEISKKIKKQIFRENEYSKLLCHIRFDENFYYWLFFEKCNVKKFNDWKHLTSYSCSQNLFGSWFPRLIVQKNFQIRLENTFYAFYKKSLWIGAIYSIH